MAVIQTLQSRPPTFGELADTILQYLVKLALQYKCERVDFVIDQYPEISIKNVERSRRAVGGTQQVQIYGRTQKTPSFYLMEQTKRHCLNSSLMCGKMLI